MLLAIADANYCFTMVDIGGRGRESDGGIFKRSNLGERLHNNNLNIPPPSTVVDRILPYVFVADEAFQLTNFMLRPYPGRKNDHLPEIKTIFNYRLSRARRIIENTFGILGAKWRIFRKPINCEVQTVINIVKSTVCLHNFVKKNDNQNRYVPPGYVDTENENGDIVYGDWRKDMEKDNALERVSQIGSNTYTKNAAEIRDDFANYFIHEGSVPWQWGRTHT